MKILIIVSCALSAVSAGLFSHGGGYHSHEHHPVIHNGVPVDTPEVQHARAAHLAALQAASAHFGHSDHIQYEEGGLEGYSHDDSNYNYHVNHISAPIHHISAPIHHISAPIHHHEHAYQTSHVQPEIGHDGKPLDTPEVELAKAKHFQAVHEALSKVSHHGPIHHYRRKRGLFGYEHAPVISHGHATSYASLYSGDGHHHEGYSTHQTHDPVYGHHDSHYIPHYDHHGHPLDTPEVEHAKALHFAAHHQAKYGYHSGPVDTPEVQHAKSLHFAAHAKALHHY